MTNANDELPKAPPPPEVPANDSRSASFGAAMGFLLLGALTGALASIAVCFLFIYFLAYIVVLGWIPFFLAGAVIVVAGWKIAKLRWYGWGVLIGPVLLHGYLTMLVYGP